jgi:hypothetical protein
MIATLAASETADLDTTPPDRPGYEYLADDVRDADKWLDVDSELSEWLRDSSQLVEPGGSPPSSMLIRKARKLLEWFRFANGSVAPDIVAPDNAGGLAFEWHSGNVFQMVSVRRDGSSVLSVFRGGKCVSQRRIP